MKKFFAMILALCMVCGAALAAVVPAIHEITEGGRTAETTVNYVIEENKSFTVTIPAEVNIDPATNKGTLNFEIKAPQFNVPGHGISVELTGAANGCEADPTTGDGVFQLTCGGESIPYMLQLNENKESSVYLSKSSVIMNWSFVSGVEPTASSTVTAIAKPGDGLIVAGEYKDKLTFTVSVVGPSPAPQP